MSVFNLLVPAVCIVLFCFSPEFRYARRDVPQKRTKKGARQRITAPLSEAAMLGCCATVAWAFVILLLG